MKERGIVMSGEHPRLILEGKKTQTRRLVHPQPESGLRIGCYYGGGRPAEWVLADECGDAIDAPPIKCPYEVGQRLYVQETWKYYNCGEIIIYKADGDLSTGLPWKSPRFMFKKYARIWLEITGLRAERLQDISEEDAKAEGAECVIWHGEYAMQYEKQMPVTTYKAGFANLWDSINGKKHPWADNPWVWKIEFKLVKQ